MSINEAEKALKTNSKKFKPGSVTVNKRRGKSHVISYTQPNGRPGTYTAQARLVAA